MHAAFPIPEDAPVITAVLFLVKMVDRFMMDGWMDEMIDAMCNVVRWC